MSSEIDKTVSAKSYEPELEKQPDPPATPPPPPNGGLTSWLQVAGAFFLFFNSW